MDSYNTSEGECGRCEGGVRGGNWGWAHESDPAEVVAHALRVALLTKGPAVPMDGVGAAEARLHPRV